LSLPYKEILKLLTECEVEKEVNTKIPCGNQIISG
jgi:hypothetical protein